MVTIPSQPHHTKWPATKRRTNVSDGEGSVRARDMRLATKQKKTGGTCTVQANVRSSQANNAVVPRIDWTMLLGCEKTKMSFSAKFYRRTHMRYMRGMHRNADSHELLECSVHVRDTSTSTSKCFGVLVGRWAKPHYIQVQANDSLLHTYDYPSLALAGTSFFFCKAYGEDCVSMMVVGGHVLTDAIYGKVEGDIRCPSSGFNYHARF